MQAHPAISPEIVPSLVLYNFPTPQDPSIIGLHRQRRCQNFALIELLVFARTFRLTVEGRNMLLRLTQFTARRVGGAKLFCQRRP